MKLRISLVTISILILTFSVSGINAQTIPPLNDNEFILRHDSFSSTGLLGSELLGRSTIDGSVTYVALDATGQQIEVRLATPNEIELYTTLEDQTKQSTAAENLKLGAEGTSWDIWVANRTAELEACESNMLDLINALNITDWDSRTSNFRNQSIQGIATCEEVNARVNRLTIQGILEILTEKGLNK